MKMAEQQQVAMHRLAAIARHLAPHDHHPPKHSSLHSTLCSGPSSLSRMPRKASKYEQVHGPVSRTLPIWTPVLAGGGFEDILYEKAEGIAKVTLPLALASHPEPLL